MDNATQLRLIMQRKQILLVAAQLNVSSELLAAVCWQESSFNIFAFRFEPMFKERYVDKLSVKKIKSYNHYIISNGVPSIETERIALATSWGIMQIMGLTARELDFRGQYLSELCSPFGLYQGAKYLKKQLDKYKGDVEKAISAYNAGTATKNNEGYINSVIEKMKEIAAAEILTKEALLCDT
jgi:hypothetical protein